MEKVFLRRKIMRTTRKREKRPLASKIVKIQNLFSIYTIKSKTNFLCNTMKMILLTQILLHNYRTGWGVRKILALLPRICKEEENLIEVVALYFHAIRQCIVQLQS